uniref:Uncharacterized protein n=1 Tax=Neolamprologus brichardi TaxID=32507 RepID=A0A3Q4FXJ2_NEOBR
CPATIIQCLFVCFSFVILHNIFNMFSAILDDPMECSRGERLAITLAKDSINRSSNRSITGKLEVDIFELLRDSEYEMGETNARTTLTGRGQPPIRENSFLPLVSAVSFFR